MQSDHATSERIDRLEQAVQSLVRENQAMADRLDRAKHQARWWRYFLGALAVAAVFTVLVARAVDTGRPKTIEAEQFRLRDKDGNMRAVLCMTPEGYPVLAFYDQYVHSLLQLYVWNEGALGIGIFDKKSNLRLGIGGAQGGGVGMAVYNGSGKKRVGLGMSQSGLAGMEIFDRDEVVRIEDFVQADGSAGRTVFDHGQRKDVRDRESSRGVAR